MRRRLFVPCVFVTGLVLALSGCSLKTMAARTVADTLAAPSDVMTRDDDPDLIRAAIPFGLKTYESLLETIPQHQALLVATCAGYTSFAYAFVETDADLLNDEHQAEAKALRERAFGLYLRAKDYCVRAMNVRFPGLMTAILSDPVPALARLKLKREDLDVLYWTAASWGSAMSLKKDPGLVIDFPVVRALAERALEIDETWNHGALHQLMITLDGQGEIYGGTEAGARKHFARTVELTNGGAADPYLALAMGVVFKKQDRAEFKKLMEQALAVDISKNKSITLVNLIAQKRAQALLDRIDELFVK